ncbi:MAG: DoxX family membrane protein [Rhodobacteraceae bacterium]|nr:DoxX family membrane protein [Paracoccaceae bacterium]
MTDFITFVGRFLLAALFIGGAVQKALDPIPAQDLLAMQGWPVWLIWPALLFNAAGALALILGVALRPAAALAAYCAVTSLFHFIPDDPWQMTIFVKNWAISGGLLVLAAQGGGRWQLR